MRMKAHSVPKIRITEMEYTLIFYKNTYNLAEPEDVLILAHAFS